VAGFYTLEGAVARRLGRAADADSADAHLQSLLADLFRVPISEE